MSNITLQKLKAIRQYDDTRPGFAGEHWLVLAAGVGAWLASRRSASPVVRTLGLSDCRITSFCARNASKSSLQSGSRAQVVRAFDSVEAGQQVFHLSSALTSKSTPYKGAGDSLPISRSIAS